MSLFSLYLCLEIRPRRPDEEQNKLTATEGNERSLLLLIYISPNLTHYSYVLVSKDLSAKAINPRLLFAPLDARLARAGTAVAVAVAVGQPVAVAPNRAPKLMIAAELSPVPGAVPGLGPEVPLLSNCAWI